jgi:peptide chain release factor 2
MSEAGFWDDQAAAKTTITAANRIKGWLEPLRDLESKLEEAELFAQMVDEDPGAAAEAEKSLQSASALLERLETNFMLGGPDDDKGAILEINPGAGGVDSQDWAEMLLRMYTRFLEEQGWDHTLTDLAPAEEAGIKHASFEIRAPYAYGYLKGESGVHRLVRISPFDAQARRQTSFASCFVYPLIESDVDAEIEILEKDLRVDTYRSSGAGGQHVNKTESAIRITHLPTGIVVACQNERSQHRNRDAAMNMLRARLYQRRLEEEQARMDSLSSGKMKIDFGSQIRSYVLQPYTKVKDHRTEVETGDAQRVLGGDLDLFIQAYLRMSGSSAAAK